MYRDSSILVALRALRCRLDSGMLLKDAKYDDDDDDMVWSNFLVGVFATAAALTVSNPSERVKTRSIGEGGMHTRPFSQSV